MKKRNQSSSPRKRTFQSDIVVDEDGGVHISFFGPELLHLIPERIATPLTDKPWSLKLTSNFQKTDVRDEYAHCMMCPKKCGFNRLKSTHGTCGDAVLRVSNHGLSFGDEKELSQGGGSGLLFLSGCPLTCPSCINPEKVRNDGDACSTMDFLQMVESLYRKGANNIQILSPTVHLPELKVALTILKQQAFPLPIIFKSSGYESVIELRKFEGLVDIYVPDYKFSNSCYWKKQSGANDYHEVFLEALVEMYRQAGSILKNESGVLQKGVMIRHVKNPYLSQEERKQIDEFLNHQPADILVSILDNFVVLD